MEIDGGGVVTTHVGKEQMYGSPIVKEMLGYETQPVVVRKFKRREARLLMLIKISSRPHS